MSAYTEHLDKMGDVLEAAGLDRTAAGAVDAAVDILTDDGVTLARAMALTVAALKAGWPLEAWARHVVTLRRAIL